MEKIPTGALTGMSVKWFNDEAGKWLDKAKNPRLSDSNWISG